MALVRTHAPGILPRYRRAGFELKSIGRGNFIAGGEIDYAVFDYLEQELVRLRPAMVASKIDPNLPWIVRNMQADFLREAARDATENSSREPETAA